MENLSWYMEWGSSKWQQLLRYGIDSFLGRDLHGKQLLDIGTRYGKMAVLFARLGADVTEIDIVPSYLETAKVEAARQQVSEHVRFLCYDGRLSLFAEESFDIVFTKSVLVAVPELEAFLLEVKRILRLGGKFLFLENSYGNCLVHALRLSLPRSWDCRRCHYFGPREERIIQKVFPSSVIKRAWIPPIWLIYGTA